MNNIPDIIGLSGTTVEIDSGPGMLVFDAGMTEGIPVTLHH